VTRLRIRPEADRDIDQAADNYAREANVDVALRFLGAIEETYSRLCRHPQSGHPVLADSPRLAGLRFALVPGFERYLVFHIPSPGWIEVVRVLHGARDLEHILGEEPGEGV
jgi:toxin ParE1/3/4